MRTYLPSIGFWFAAVPSFLLAGRAVWEQTVLSWERGPQMVGFSLMHSGLGVVLAFACYGAMGWVLLTLVLAVSSTRRHVPTVVGAVVVGAALALVFLPYGTWVRVFAGRIAGGPHAAEFLVHMAALGELSAVRALLDQGVPVNASGHAGIRPIVAAENANQPAMREYLVSRGARHKGDEQ